MFKYFTEKIRKISQVTKRERRFLDDTNIREIKNNLIISSFGFKLLSDVKNLNSFSSEEYCIPNIHDIKDGTLIYIHSSSLKYFSDKYLKKIDCTFSLICGDSDLCFDEITLKQSYMKRLLQSENVKSIYCQNLNVHHPKLNFLPIGLNYHSIYERFGFWGESLNPDEQEKNIIRISSYNFKEKILKAYCNWHFNAQRGDRADCIKKVNKEICFFEKTKVLRGASYMNNSKYAFTLCPSGEGYDCHRTYESIILGSIPIMKKSVFSSYLKNLPIVEIKCWRDLNRELLKEKLNEIQKKTFNFSLITNQYWSCRFNNLKINSTEISFSEFLKNLKSQRLGIKA